MTRHVSHKNCAPGRVFEFFWYRPDNKRGCHGAILAEVNRSENTIYYACTDCDHEGMISEWERSFSDYSAPTGAILIPVNVKYL